MTTLNTTIIQAMFPAIGEAALAKGIPMEMLDLVRRSYKAAGITVRVCYRGPRKASIGRIMKGVNGYSNYKRSAYSAQSSCLKSDATSFAVYRK